MYYWSFFSIFIIGILYKILFEFQHWTAYRLYLSHHLNVKKSTLNGIKLSYPIPIQVAKIRKKFIMIPFCLEILAQIAQKWAFVQRKSDLQPLSKAKCMKIE